MSCLQYGFDALCGQDETLAVRHIEETAKATIGSLMASIQHSNTETSSAAQSEHLVPNRSVLTNDVEDGGRQSAKKAEALHRDELALVEEGPVEDMSMLEDPSVLVRHIDEKSKAKTRAQELEELRQRSLASRKGEQQ
jgi:hypothetical protein